LWRVRFLGSDVFALQLRSFFCASTDDSKTRNRSFAKKRVRKLRSFPNSDVFFLRIDNALRKLVFYLHIKGENTKFHRDGIFFFTSPHSVDRYRIRKYPSCHISNTPLFNGVLRCDSRGISAARMELGMDFFLRRIMVILDGIFEYSTPLAKAQPPTPHELNHDIRTLP
jgi:hypothetical protein